MSPPRTRLRCLDKGPEVRRRNVNLLSTGGRPPRKSLAAIARRSTIQRPTRHDLYVMKRQEALRLAAQEALKLEQEEAVKNAENLKTVEQDQQLNEALNTVTMQEKEPDRMEETCYQQTQENTSSKQ